MSTRAPGRPRDELNLDGLQPITEPVERGGLKHLVQQSLRRAILSGSLPAGSPLRETQVAEALGVSRVPLREALALLEQEGLVERRPNHGAYVVEVRSHQELTELAGLRAMLESYALSIGSGKLTEDALDDLAVIVAESWAATEARDQARLFELDFAFHQGIVGLAGNRWVSQAWATVANVAFWAFNVTWLRHAGAEWDTDAVQRPRQVTPAYSGERLLYLADIPATHRLILNELRAGRFNEATAHLERHILEATRHFLHDLQEPQDSEP